MNETTIDQYFAEIPDKIRPYALQFYELGRSINKFDNPSVYYNYSMSLFKIMTNKYEDIKSAQLNTKIMLTIPKLVEVDSKTLYFHLKSLLNLIDKALEDVLNNYNTKDLSNVVNTLDNIQKLKGSFMLGSGNDFQTVMEDFRASPWKAVFN